MTEERETVALSPKAVAIVTAHCERTGLTRAAAIEDLLARGAQQVDVQAVRGMVEEVRAYVIDTLRALDAAGPYAIAGLSLMAHWAARTGATTLGEREYAEAALDAGRAGWDGHLASRAVALPSRQAAEQPSFTTTREQG